MPDIDFSALDNDQLYSVGKAVFREAEARLEAEGQVRLLSFFVVIHKLTDTFIGYARDAGLVSPPRRARTGGEDDGGDNGPIDESGGDANKD